MVDPARCRTLLINLCSWPNHGRRSAGPGAPGRCSTECLTVPLAIDFLLCSQAPRSQSVWMCGLPTVMTCQNSLQKMRRGLVRESKSFQAPGLFFLTGDI
jgi:hypothetical protein